MKNFTKAIALLLTLLPLAGCLQGPETRTGPDTIFGPAQEINYLSGKKFKSENPRLYFADFPGT